MSKYDNAKKLGLRDKESKKLISVYPDKIEGTDEEIEKKIKDWFYQTSCSAEEALWHSYVDVLTEEELKMWK